MTFFGGLGKGLAAVVVSVLAMGLFSAAAGPTASFTMTPPGNPVMGQVVQFTDTSTGSPTSWAWSFGDGQVSTQQSPTHVYSAPGSFSVTLTATNSSGSSAPQTQSAFVSPNDTLRLNASHPFTVKLTATNQHNGNAVSSGLAIPQNDLFGYFALPGATGDPNNAEVFVKILDGRGINGQYWVFVGHVTDLIYDLTVTEVATGFFKTYHKDAGDQKGRSDTAGFAATPTPGGASPTPTPTPPGSSTRIVNVGQTGTSFTDTVSGVSATTIHVGDTVRWVFVDSNPTMYHSTTSGQCSPAPDPYSEGSCTADGVWDSSLRLPGSNYSYTFTTVGTFNYFCTVHNSAMTGRVTVQP